ncbi:glycosyltransferase family 4 protein [Zoogloea sp.]|uniref:glycosyltransferase family 4 protein n=1 Tax=Zoogloea sp. TaxID=49181 RepID=UPI00262779D3|nr:glycosyltransferase family 4 protein [Zoogloea sp.]MDD3352543.1 glycosyltransferase family 4 protein [Zoogloea sp.]
MKLTGLRIALIGPLPPPAGGMANQTRQLHELLSAEGACVEVVQVNAPYRPAWMGKLQGVRALARLLPYLNALWQAAGRADVFHVMANSGWSWHLFAAPAIWIGSLRGVPVVVNYHGGEAESFLREHLASFRRTLARASLLAVPSGFLEDVFSRFGIRSQVVSNVVDLARFHPAAPGRVAEPHLVVARNLEAIYGIDTALQAFVHILQRWPGARLSLAGSGPQEKVLRDRVEALGLGAQVCFTGRLDREAMASLIRSADLMLNPSRVDNMPISILEALASGVPVVSTDVGGIPYLVRHGESALLVPRDDPASMAGAALRILSDPALAGRLRESGLREVKSYSWSVVREHWAHAYSEAGLGRSRPIVQGVQV